MPSPNGYGKPLGNKHNNNLTGFFKIKYRGIGIRVVYTLVLKDIVMNIVVISERDDNYCYNAAANLYKKYGEDIFTDIFQDFPTNWNNSELVIKVKGGGKEWKAWVKGYSFAADRRSDVCKRIWGWLR